MDVHSNSTVKTSKRQADTFLADAVRTPTGLIGYRDGFRFGIGFMLANLLLVLVVGGLAWGIILALHLGS